MAGALNSTKLFTLVGDPIEKGYFGKLVRIKSLSDGKEYIDNQIELEKAVGGSRTSKADDAHIRETIAREAKMFVTVSHPNLVRVYNAFEEDGIVHVIMDDCKSGSLDKVIQSRFGKNRTFSELEIVTLGNQLIQGINYLHVVKELLHRDIRAENIFLTDRGQVVKLANFGIVKMMTDKPNIAKSLIGTPTHMPPEVVRGQRYDFKSEIWSFGVVLYHIATLNLPFEVGDDDFDGLFNAIQTKNPKPLPIALSAELRDLILAKLLSKDQRTRLDALGVMSAFSGILKSNAKRATGTVNQQQSGNGQAPSTPPVDPQSFTQAEISALFAEAKRGNVPEFEKSAVKHVGVQMLFKLRDEDDNPLLHVAAMYGQFNAVNFLLDKGANIETPGQDGRTALLCAADKGQMKIVNHLISRGAKIDARSYAVDSESSAVHLAASAGFTDTVKALLEYKTEMIDWTDRDGDRPIHRAAMQGQTGVVEFLLARGAKIEEKGRYGRTPFLYAVCKGCLETVQRLVKLGANIHEVSNKEDGEGSAIHLAADFGQVQIMSYLLSIHPAFMTSRDSNGNMPINAAALGGRGEVLKFLLQKGANIEERGFHGRTPLLNACGKGNAEIAKLLIELKADVSVRSGDEDDGAMSIHLAASFGSADVINVLLDTYPSLITLVDKNGDYALNVAALNGQNDAILALLSRGADIESRGYQGRTPLLSAASSGHVRAVELLLSKGARLMAQSDPESGGDQAIHLAAYFGHMDVVSFLVRARANLVLAKNANGELPQQRAAVNNHQEIVDFLKTKKPKI